MKILFNILRCVAVIFTLVLAVNVGVKIDFYSWGIPLLNPYGINKFIGGITALLVLAPLLILIEFIENKKNST